MTLHTWLAFATLSLLVSLFPGPAVVSVISTALRRGFWASLATNAGTLCGDAVFVALTACGLGAVLVASHAAFAILKWLGIAYLAFLGLRAFLERRDGIALDEARSASPASRAFWLGLSTQLANPKVILFFGALTPQFVDVRNSVMPQFVALGATFIVSDCLVFAAYGALAHQARELFAMPEAARITRRLTGAAMLGAAARLAIQR